MKENKYFDIHVRYDIGAGDGYSIPVMAPDAESARTKAIQEKMFEYEDDAYDIDYIAELDVNEYNRLVRA